MLMASAVCESSSEYKLKDIGSFYIGGRQASLSGLPVREVVYTKGGSPMKVDPNGDFEVEQMYVQYFIPVDQKSKYPLLMWHGGSLTGVTWETKPDGSPGWLQYFLKAGHAVYVSDAVERGRASWARYPEIFSGEPFFRTKKEAWTLFRIGSKESYNTVPNKRVAYRGMKFPVSAFDQFCKQVVPRWYSDNEATQAAYNALIKKVGLSVLVLHSQAGNFGFNVALTAPDRIKAIIAIEPSGAPKPGQGLDKLKDVPILVVWGDYLDKPDLSYAWRKKIVSKVDAFAKDLRARGGKVDWIELPKMGIKGNEHMLMMDTNSDQIADIVQEWMGKKCLMN
jgi:pimeloyl-ACP methyl ester carboxylesterase